MAIKFKKTFTYKDISVYQVSDGQRTIVFEVTQLGKDKVGHLRRVESSKFPMFESYSISEVKDKVISFFKKSQSIKEK